MNPKGTVGTSRSTNRPRVVTTARVAERVALQKRFGDLELWLESDKHVLPEGVAAVIVPAGTQSVRCGSRIFQLPPDNRSGLSSAERSE